MTAKEEAKALAEKCLEAGWPFEVEYYRPPEHNRFWARGTTETLGYDWDNDIVGIRLVFEA